MVHDVFVCHTAGPFAIGVYIQDNGGPSIANMSTSDVFIHMGTTPSKAYIELFTN